MARRRDGQPAVCLFRGQSSWQQGWRGGSRRRRLHSQLPWPQVASLLGALPRHRLGVCLSLPPPLSSSPARGTLSCRHPHRADSAEEVARWLTAQRKFHAWTQTPCHLTPPPPGFTYVVLVAAPVSPCPSSSPTLDTGTQSLPPRPRVSSGVFGSTALVAYASSLQRALQLAALDSCRTVCVAWLSLPPPHAPCPLPPSSVALLLLAKAPQTRANTIYPPWSGVPQAKARPTGRPLPLLSHPIKRVRARAGPASRPNQVAFNSMWWC